MDPDLTCALHGYCPGVSRGSFYIDEPRMVKLSVLAKHWGITRDGAWNYIKRGKLAKRKLYPIDTPRPVPITRNQRGRFSKAIAINLGTFWATWPAPERAP